MSTKKDQYLESARKWVVKGQLDRAIKDYQQVVALDPSDMKHRQKLAELLVRVGRKVPAINEYDVIGRYYAENGYYLKAIAVYKQIQKLDPEDLAICLKLGEYNRKQGLIGNALAEYGLVLDHYQQTGDSKEAFKILEKMVEVDPENLDTLLKYSEARYAAGEWDDAYEDFSRLALLLLKRGDKAWFNRICDRIRSLYPDRSEFILTVLDAQIASGDTANAIPVLQEILKRDKYNLPAWKLLVRAYRNAGDIGSFESALKYMIHFFPKETSPREGLVQLSLERGHAEEALSLISAHLGTFLMQRDFAVAERLCDSLWALLSDREKLLPILKKLYEASGEPEKLQTFVARLEPTDSGEAACVTAEQEDEPDQEPEIHQADVSVSTTAADDSYDAEDDLWEDEIDLSMLENLAEGAADGAVAVEEEVFPAVARFEIPEGIGEDFEEISAVEGLGDIAPLDWLSGPSSPVTEGESLFSEEDLPDFSEFSSAIDDLFKDDVPAPPVHHGNKYDTETVLSAFRKGLDEQIEASDSETHYDLGIAYKEMGLFDDAVNEFKRAALNNPARLVDCLTLQGACFREKGDAGAAEEAFRTAIEIKDASVEQHASALYDMALFYESEGRNAEADRLFREVQGISPGFRDVTEKVGHQHGEAGGIA